MTIDYLLSALLALCEHNFVDEDTPCYGLYEHCCPIDEEVGIPTKDDSDSQYLELPAEEENENA